MKTKLLILSLALNVLVFGLLAADQPNIIMILADDVGLGNLGCTARSCRPANRCGRNWPSAPRAPWWNSKLAA